MRISDWSSDVCSSDLFGGPDRHRQRYRQPRDRQAGRRADQEIPSHEDDQGHGFRGRRFGLLSVGTGLQGRSEERRVGKECGSTFRSRGSPAPSNKKTKKIAYKEVLSEKYSKAK